MNRTQVWSSGGGTQSAAIAALIVLGEISPDISVIADTGREQSTTWEYMDEIITPALAKVGVVLHRIKSSDFATVDLYGGVDKDSLLIPVFTDKSGQIGKLPTFCSSEWKTRVIQRWANQQGVIAADMWLGISTDEKHRMKASKGKWGYRHILIEKGMNRGDCQALVKRMGWPPAPRSSCWMCPNHLQEEWRDIKANKPNDWKKAIDMDYEMRQRDPNAYLHHDCIPLDKADLEDRNGVLFNHCDSGLCFV
jgi:hypothetical protein